MNPVINPAVFAALFLAAAIFIMGNNGAFQPKQDPSAETQN
ncbi:MAG: hypothetical protein AAGU12_16265 [Clostridiales bacterium]